MDIQGKVNVLLNIIIKNYFLNARCLLLISDFDNEISLINNFSIPIVSIKINDELNSESLFHSFGCQHFLIKTNMPLSTFKQCEENIRYNTMERFNNRKYVLLPGANIQENIRDLPELDELNFVSDLLLIMAPVNTQNNESLYLRTHKYIGKGDHNKLIFLDKWFLGNESFWKGRNLFPDKLKNQMGRDLKMSAFTYEPYVILGNGPNDYLGTELLTCIEFCKYRNMNPVIIYTEQDNWGDVYSNFTGYGLLGDVAMDKSDIGFDALWTYAEYYPYLDLTTPLIRSGAVCLVPAPKFAAGWATPLYSFTFYMWICLGCFYLTTSIFLFSIQLVYTKNNFLLKRIGILYTQRSPIRMFTNSFFIIGKLIIIQTLTKHEILKGKAWRLFIGVMFIVSIFLTTSYSSGLASIMTIPRYEQPIDTPEDFINSDLTWGTTGRSWITPIEKTDNPYFQKIVEKFYEASEDELRENSLKGGYAFGIERLPNGNFGIGSYIKADVIENYHVMKSDLYWEESYIYTRKSFILLPLMDKFILRIQQAGLLQKWQNDAVLKSMDPIVQRSVVYYYHNSPQRLIIKLKWMHVEGAFGLLVFGLSLSILNFLLEIFIHKTSHKFQKANLHQKNSEKSLYH